MSKQVTFVMTVAFCILLLLSGCSSTTINGVWKDPAYNGGKLDRVLVISVAKKDLLRRLYEDAFVAALDKRGIPAIPGYRVLPAGAGIDPGTIPEHPGGRDFRFVLISRLVDKKTVQMLNPGTTVIRDMPGYYGYPYYRHWRDYYRSSYRIIETTPPYTTESTLLILETNLYTAADKLIFSVQTETLLDYSAGQTVNDIVQKVVQELADKGLI